MINRRRQFDTTLSLFVSFLISCGMNVWAHWNFQTFYPMINHLCTRLEESFNEVVNGPIVSKKQTNNKMKQHKIKGKTVRFHTLPRGLNKKKEYFARGRTIT